DARCGQIGIASGTDREAVGVIGGSKASMTDVIQKEVRGGRARRFHCGAALGQELADLAVQGIRILIRIEKVEEVVLAETQRSGEIFPDPVCRMSEGFRRLEAGSFRPCAGT